MRLLMLVTLLAFASPSNAQEAGNRLNLICNGSGTATRAAHGTSFGMDANGQPTSSNNVSFYRMSFEDQVSLWVEGNDGQIKLPSALMRNGKPEWLPIIQLKVTETDITGELKFGFLKKLKILVDRMAGTITLSAKSANYSGTCSPYQPKDQVRAF